MKRQFRKRLKGRLVKLASGETVVLTGHFITIMGKHYECTLEGQKVYLPEKAFAENPFHSKKG